MLDTACPSAPPGSKRSAEQIPPQVGSHSSEERAGARAEDGRRLNGLILNPRLGILNPSRGLSNPARPTRRTSEGPGRSAGTPHLVGPRKRCSPGRKHMQGTKRESIGTCCPTPNKILDLYFTFWFMGGLEQRIALQEWAHALPHLAEAGAGMQGLIQTGPQPDVGASDRVGDTLLKQPTRPQRKSKATCLRNR